MKITSKPSQFPADFFQNRQVSKRARLILPNVRGAVRPALQHVSEPPTSNMGKGATKSRFIEHKPNILAPVRVMGKSQSTTHICMPQSSQSQHDIFQGISPKVSPRHESLPTLKPWLHFPSGANQNYRRSSAFDEDLHRKQSQGLTLTFGNILPQMDMRLRLALPTPKSSH